MEVDGALERLVLLVERRLRVHGVAVGVLRELVVLALGEGDGELGVDSAGSSPDHGCGGVDLRPVVLRLEDAGEDRRDEGRAIGLLGARRHADVAAPDEVRRRVDTGRQPDSGGAADLAGLHARVLVVGVAVGEELRIGLEVAAVPGRAGLCDGEGGCIGTVLQLASLVVQRADVDDQGTESEQDDGEDGDENGDRSLLLPQPLHRMTPVSLKVTGLASALPPGRAAMRSDSGVMYENW